ncbi:acyl CoA binding protein-domain-containing protein [Chlamydoabsidia padenii]|nr:acyl CoA binding protein-domain-containing protein [Chlamydoabsidia padenii]
MSSIPSHYSPRYVNQRYNKALHIVQNLPATSSFQPNKDEKLLLYSLYKQVSHGDIDTQRPGIFDVVGRAKWDAWKKLQGMNTLEAKHQYVDTLLKVCAEAYKKPAAKAQVQQIIQVFATLRPTDDDSDDDSDDSNIEDGHDDEGDTDESVDEEEQAYLMDIQKSIPTMTPSKSTSTTTGSQNSDTYHSLRSPAMQSSTSIRTKQSNRRSWHGKPPVRLLRRAPSVESTRSMITAPSAPSRRPPSRSSSINLNSSNNNHSTNVRPASSMSHRSDRNRYLPRRTPLPQMTSTTTDIPRPLHPPIPDEHFDNSVNPWAAANQEGGNNTSITRRRYKLKEEEDENTSEDSIDEEYSQNYLYTRPPAHNTITTTTNTTIPSRVPSRSSRLSSSSVSSYYGHHQQPHRQLQPPSLPSSLLEESINTSVTGLPSETYRQQRYPGNRLLTDQQYTSVVALGPATKRALETLQAEIIGLNERIDGLRQELVDRDDAAQKKNLRLSNAKNDNDDDDEVWDAWGWVLKAALKHTAVNLVAAFAIIFFLFKRGNPIAYAFIGSLHKQWCKIKFGFIKA